MLKDDTQEIKNKIVQELEKKSKEDNNLSQLIQKSLEKAHSIAQKELKHETYNELIWPSTLDSVVTR